MSSFWFGNGGSAPITPIPHAPITPFDESDQYGQVHTVLPPEQVIPPRFTDPLWLRGDFTGVTIPGDFTPRDPDPAKQTAMVIANGGVRITSGRWTGLWIPFLVGANSTPPTMLMTPMLVLYPPDVQNAFLTEYAERAYDDFVIALDGWNLVENGFNPTPANLLAWHQRIKSAGFRTVSWRGDPTAGVDAVLQTLLDAGATNFFILGEEVDSKVTSEVYEALVQQVDRYIGGRIPIGAHFTADGDRHMGYPIGFPRDTFINDWSLYNGRLHLMQQLDVTASAGLQGASMYYARQYVNAAIGDGAKGKGAPDSRVIAFEIMATAQLYGRCTEEYGCLRSWESLCGTRTDPRVRAVSGFVNGCRYPKGYPIV